MPIENLVVPDEPSISRAEAAYRSIRDAILSNHLHIGEHLREESLAQQLGMSRTPIREALGRLRSEGLVKEAKPRGYVVSSVSPTDVFHVYAVREELEGLCLRLAATRITPHELFQLSTIIERMEQALEDPPRFSRLNLQFHGIIVEATGNPVLKKIMDDLMAVVARFPFSAYEVEGRTRQVIAEHRKVLEALELHDPEAAERAIQEHLRTGLDARLAALRRYALAQSPDDVDSQWDDLEAPAHGDSRRDRRRR